MTHLEPVSSEKNPYERKVKEPESLEIEGNDDANIYEVEKILIKRKIYIGRKRRRRTHFEFRMKWTE